MSGRRGLPLPKLWPRRVKSAVLAVVSLARFTLLQARAKASLGETSGSRQAETERLLQENASLRDELRLKDDRMRRVPPHRRPQYLPQERPAILELRAWHGWSLAETARTFLVTAETVAAWQRRIDEDGADPLVQLRTPVNRFPELVGYIVQRLRTMCPTLGKRKVAQMLARAGLHLGTTTVGRLTQRPTKVPDPQPTAPSTRVVTAKRPNHVWHVDLTAVPISGGFWTAWVPFSLPQCWPFCWWQVVVVDHFSRRVMAITACRKQPTSHDVQLCLALAIRRAKSRPKYIICDHGPQFWCDDFKTWCKRRRIRPRFGAVGKHGSIAVVERFIRTLKELLREIVLPMSQKKHEQELALLADWYNEHRPHETLGGRTPNEVYFPRFPSHRRPRWEPRSRWPRGSPCAGPCALVRGKPGMGLQLSLDFLGGRRHLPIISLHRAA